jgi:hypothetical protein
MKPEDQCSATIHTVDPYFGHECSIKASMHHGGKRFCKLHYPPYVEARLAARNKAWDEKWDAEKALNLAKSDAQSELERKGRAYDRLALWEKSSIAGVISWVDVAAILDTK